MVVKNPTTYTSVVLTAQIDLNFPPELVVPNDTNPVPFHIARYEIDTPPIEVKVPHKYIWVSSTTCMLLTTPPAIAPRIVDLGWYNVDKSALVEFKYPVGCAK